MLAETILKHARVYLGVHEEPPGSNDGPLIRQWLSNVGMDHPAPWCAAFAWSVADFASGECGLRNPLYKTASSQALWEKTPLPYRIYEPWVGALCVFEHLTEGKPDGHGHVCIVENVDGDYVETIDGNSDMQGSRTGGSVVRLRWPWRTGRRGNLRVRGYLLLEMQF